MSMKVERSSLESIRKRIELNKKKVEEKKKEYDVNQRLQELKEEVNCGKQVVVRNFTMYSLYKTLLI